ncbi:MAG TPA: heme-binding beta-barrel domain-containing protein [Acidimicrobiales bacterium]
MSTTGVEVYGTDYFTEPDGDPDTVANLGPLAPLAGSWLGEAGVDDHPVAVGTEQDAYIEHYDLEPIDRQTNGPQLLYGLRYHTHIVKPGEVETFHDQVGYWLWEPATRTITHTLAIPRAQVLLASGTADPDATEFEITAAAGTEGFGILSSPFLEHAFRTTSFRMHVTVNPDASWSYEQETVLEIPDRPEPFRHVDRNTLVRIGPPLPNPMARTEADPASLGIGDLRHESGNLL